MTVDVPKNTMTLSVDDYVSLHLAVRETQLGQQHFGEKLDNVEKKVDGLADHIKNHMDAEERAKKNILKILGVIAIGIILNALGLPVGDFLSLLKGV